jgi:hypothetical protein
MPSCFFNGVVAGTKMVTLSPKARAAVESPSLWLPVEAATTLKWPRERESFAMLPRNLNVPVSWRVSSFSQIERGRFAGPP